MVLTVRAMIARY